MRRLLAVLPALLLLGACASIPPAPSDHFYRLQPVTTTPARLLSGAVAVHDFHADSLYAERPIIYVDAGQPRELHQYHYHLWLYPPTALVQEHLTASLGGALDFTASGSAPYALDGRILGFERVISGSSSKAVVALELCLTAGGKVLFAKTYQAEQPAEDGSLGGCATAMEQALSKVYAAFLADVAKVRPPL